MEKDNNKIILYIIIFLLTVTVLLLIGYIVFGKVHNTNNKPNNEREPVIVPQDDDKNDTEVMLDNEIPVEIKNFPVKNDDGVVIKKVSELTEEDLKIFESHGDHVPSNYDLPEDLQQPDNEEPMIYFYKNHIIKYWPSGSAGYSKLVIDNGTVEDYTVNMVNAIGSNEKYTVTPVIHDGVLHIVSKSSTCFKYEDYTVNALDYYIVKLSDDYNNESKLIKTFKSEPEGAADGPECD